MLKSEWELTIFWALDKYPLPIRAEVLFSTTASLHPRGGSSYSYSVYKCWGLKDNKKS